MQIQVRADGRRSLHPFCLLGRWLGGLRARAISTPLRATKPPDPTSASSVLVWPSCRSRVSAAARHRGYVTLRSRCNGAVHQGIRRGDRVRDPRGSVDGFRGPCDLLRAIKTRHDAQPIAPSLRVTGTGEL
jgi:hypothetical protein